MSENWVPSSISSRLHPHLNLLRDVGVSVEREVERDNLPVAICERPDVRYATRLVGRFIVRMERREGIDDLCYLGAKNDVLSSAGTALISFLLSARTIKEMLERLALITKKINGRQCSLSIGKDHTSFLSNSPICEPKSFHQRYSDWSNVVGMLMLMRNILGPRWRPHRITLQANYQVSQSVLTDFPYTDIVTGSPNTSVSFPTKNLATKIPARRSANDGQSTLVLPYEEHGTLPEFLGAVLRPYLTSSHLSVNLAAEAAGMSVRSLQRQLSSYGFNYSDVIDGERNKLAQEILTDPTIRISDIAFDLGYRNPTHFSRAFKRMTGLSPREYRNLKISAE